MLGRQRPLGLALFDYVVRLRVNALLVLVGVRRAYPVLHHEFGRVRLHLACTFGRCRERLSLRCVLRRR